MPVEVVREVEVVKTVEVPVEKIVVCVVVTHVRLTLTDRKLKWSRQSRCPLKRSWYV